MRRKALVWIIFALCILTASCRKKEAEPMDEQENQAERVEQEVQEPIESEEEQSVVVGFEDYSKEMKEDAILLVVSENLPVIEMEGAEEASAVLNEYFQKKHEAFQKDVEESYQLAKETYEGLDAAGREVFGAFSIGQTYDILYQTERFLSIEEVWTEWSGSNHPFGYTSTYTFDLSTGKKLSLVDILEDEQAAKSFARDYLIGLMQSSYKEVDFFEGYEDNVADLFADDTFYLGGEGLVVVCNPDVLAPYAEGKMEFLIPYEAFLLLKEEYKLAD